MTCPPNAPLGKVAKLLAERHVHALFVVDRNGNRWGHHDFDLMAGSGSPMMPKACWSCAG
jgi:hypothetical protein